MKDVAHNAAIARQASGGDTPPKWTWLIAKTHIVQPYPQQAETRWHKANQWWITTHGEKKT